MTDPPVHDEAEKPRRARRPRQSAGSVAVRVACDWTHTEFHAAGHVITPAGVDVPADALPALRAAADACGVHLTIEEH